ncbi:MAG: polysaccharide pyruvyl transferase family protein [Lachnospiraceae bacterium]
MKKIGIVTFHRANNYGAVLQAFSLQKMLSKKYETVIVDYRCPYIEEQYRNNKTINLKKILQVILKTVFFPKVMFGTVVRLKRFSDFRLHYFKTIGPYHDYDIKNANLQCDIFLSGSDQIWNPKWTNNDYNYFLDFADDKKKYSYAASMGEFNSIEIIPIINRLNQYQSIIVREEESVEMLNKYKIINPVFSACDPVFFWNKEEWIDNCKIKKKNRKPYILLYLVAKETLSVKFANFLSEKYNLEIVYLNQLGLTWRPDNAKVISNAGPREFLEWILNAGIVVTTSFHGVAFSLLFNIPFYYEYSGNNDNNDCRFKNMERYLDIESRVIPKNFVFEPGEINWEILNRELEVYRKKSTTLLFDSLPE